MADEISRHRALRHRLAEQGLHRAADRVTELAVLELGVQNTPAGAARLACAARLATVPAAGLPGATDATEVAGVGAAWTYRGAPHLHRAGDLSWLAAALWPLSDADALSRLSWQRSRVAATGMAPLAAFRTTAAALGEVVTEPMTKGAASAAVTARLPERLRMWCRPCQSAHVSESLFRLAALPGGIGLRTGPPLLLAPLPDQPPLPTQTAHLARSIRAYLRFLGPAGPAEVAGFLGSTRRELTAWWPDDLVPVSLDGRRVWLPADRLAAARRPPEPPAALLLPPADPYLQARDRSLIVPDPAARKVLWRVLGNPGALLVHGEIVAAWRQKVGGRDRLDITLEPFGPIPVAVRAAVEVEAQRVAAVRGLSQVRVTGW